jgi:hypothetical protein
MSGLRAAVAASLLVGAAALARAEPVEKVRLLATRVERVPETADDPAWRQGQTVPAKALHDETRVAVLGSGSTAVRVFSLVEPRHDRRKPFRPPDTPWEVEFLRERSLAGFEDVAVGTLPKGFVAGLTGGGAPGAWSVGKEDAGNAYLAQTSADVTSYRFPVLVAPAPWAKDLRVAARFKAISGTVDQAGGLLARYRDADNYYVVRANVLEGNVRLYRVVGGKREQIAGVDVEVTPAWHVLTLEVRGTKIVATFDATTRLEAEDDRIRDAGLGGLWTKADSVTWFDDLDVAAFYDE